MSSDSIGGGGAAPGGALSQWRIRSQSARAASSRACRSKAAALSPVRAAAGPDDVSWTRASRMADCTSASSASMRCSHRSSASACSRNQESSSLFLKSKRGRDSPRDQACWRSGGGRGGGWRCAPQSAPPGARPPRAPRARTRPRPRLCRPPWAPAGAALAELAAASCSSNFQEGCGFATFKKLQLPKNWQKAWGRARQETNIELSGVRRI